MGMRLIPLAALAAASLLAGCSQGDGPERGAGADSDGLTADEKRYAAAARPFMKAVVEQDHAKAYTFVSSHLTERLSAEAFAQQNRAAFTELGSPSGLGDVGGVETDPAVLAGPEHAGGQDELEKAANRILSSVAVGDMPDSIPAAVRRASVVGDVVVGKDQEGEDLTYFITVVLVDDGGDLKVGHYWFRARGILD